MHQPPWLHNALTPTSLFSPAPLLPLAALHTIPPWSCILHLLGFRLALLATAAPQLMCVPIKVNHSLTVVVIVSPSHRTSGHSQLSPYCSLSGTDCGHHAGHRALLVAVCSTEVQLILVCSWPGFTSHQVTAPTMGPAPALALAPAPAATLALALTAALALTTTPGVTGRRWALCSGP
ncbi:hypothetical protein V8C86DRAFT_2564797 [Haematococcus lacustris]